MQQYHLPPNPAKQTDARYPQYVKQFGIQESWELDALDPDVIVDLIDAEIRKIVRSKKWKARRQLQEEQRLQIKAVSRNWEPIVAGIDLETVRREIEEEEAKEATRRAEEEAQQRDEEEE